MIGDRKVSGNAFYHIPGRSIVHGTMLYDTNMVNMVGAITPNDEKLISKGVESVRQRIALLKDFVQIDIEQFKTFVRENLCKGEITLTSDDIRAIEEIEKEYLTDEFVNSVAVIDQNVVLFNDTISENLKMWDHSVEDFTMTMACIDAGIRDDIISRPRGFNTKLVRGGGNFSGGQRQRREIATALAREPVILVLDEATSALDTVMEREVMQSIRQCGASIIVIAHRLSTVRDCDEIIVMDKGHIVQRGTHDELIAQEGHYRQLMNCDDDSWLTE